MPRPKLDRRQFLRSLGSSTVAGLAARSGFASPQRASAARLLRVVVFLEAGFPTFDAAALDPATLRQSLRGWEALFADSRDLGDRLAAGTADVMVNPYGSAFPKPAWPAILAFLRAGGNLVNLGGVPFAVPVGQGKAEVRQTAYHKRLGLTQAFPVEVSGVSAWRPNQDLPWTWPLAGGFACATVHAFYAKLTSRKEWPDEDGSDGPREAVLTPLLSGFDAERRPLAVPLLQIDRLEGDFAGGRWILAAHDGAMSAAALRALVDAAARGSQVLEVRPSLASYRQGETPAVELRHLQSKAGPNGEVCRLEVFDPAGQRVARRQVPLTRAGVVLAGVATVPVSGSPRRAGGLFRVEATLAGADPAQAPRARTGFYLEPAAPSAVPAAGKLTAEGRLLQRNGRPFPVTGMNYMASDVHRRFLLEPNPLIWDRDLAEMKRAGVNLLRTGIWTGWKVLSDATGAPSEAMLRAVDAFLRTARRHDLPVIFTFFAFLPQSWGGENPYFDPRSLAAQSLFVSTIVRRFAQDGQVIWDLINEPSFSSAAHLWHCRPNYDRHEAEAWDAWLRERYPFPTEAEREAHLQQLWRTRPGDSLGLPRIEEFEDRHIFEEHRPLKATEYRLFAQHMFRRWVETMRAAIRDAGGTQLVLVGQDEGGTYERPSNAFFGEAVDLTSLHSWWFNDDLLWDSLVTQHPLRPNLVQETGVMFVERVDGAAWRSEQEAQHLLERKLALALGVGGAGALPWIWNTNPYLPSDNEAAIGVLRPDGSAKPDLLSFERIAAFARAAAPLLHGRQPAPALMVVPHSNLLSVRNTATQATRRAVRAMHYHCRTVMDAVSEYGLAEVQEPPVLVVLPAPRTLCDAAWERLLGWVEGGATLVASGPLDFDDHWLPVPRLARLGVAHRVAPVAAAEPLTIGGVGRLLAFRGDRAERVEKAVLAGDPRPEVLHIPLGRGSLLWAPVPVELAEDVESTVAHYAAALQMARLTPVFSAPELDASVLVYPTLYQRAVLYTLVSESGRPTRVRLVHRETETRLELSLPAQRAAMLLLDRRSGAVLARY